MAKFYVQLKDKLLNISNEITMESISNALGYTPSDFSGKFEDLINNPLVSDGSGELQITDEVGNIIAKVDAEGVHSIDFIGGIHKLSEKANKLDLPTKLTDLENDLILEDYATKEDVDNIDFNNIKNNPLLENENGELNITDENGNIGLKLNSYGLYVKDVYADEHKLSDKADKNWVTEFVTETVTEGKVNLDGYATEQWVEDKNYLTEHQDISHLATKEEVADIDFFDIKNNPITNAEEGNLIFVDESGNIGLKLDSDNNLTVKDVIAGDNILSNKVDKENGKGLSTEDFTTALKNKLQSLSNYDDTSITEAVNSLRDDFDTLVSGDTSTAIKTFNEIIAFLEGVEDTESLSGIIASIEQQIANIEIPSLDGYATEEYVDNKDFYEIKNNPIINGEEGNLVFVDESGNIGLKLDKDNNLTVADVVTGEHVLSNKADKSELTEKQDTLVSGTNIKTVNGQSLLGNGDLEIQEFKTYTFDYSGNYVEKTITQEELNKVLDADKIYIKHDDILVEVTVKNELNNNNIITLRGYNNSLNYVCEYYINIDKINFNYFISQDIVNLLTDSDVEDLVNAINYNEVICPNIEDGLVLEEQTLTFDPYKIVILKVGVESNELFKVFYLYSNVLDDNSLTIDFYGKYTDTSLLKATYIVNDYTLTFNIIDQSGNNIDLSNYATEDYVNQKEQAIQTWVNNKEFATQEDVANIDFYDIKDNPIINDGDGKLIFADEQGNIGLQLEADNTLYVKDVISGDNILSNKADKSDLEGFATEKYVDDKFDSIEIPDVDFTGLATEQWVEDKNYLTEHQNISHLATKEEIPSLDGYAKTEDIPSLEGYAKTSELPNFDEFAKTDDIPSLEGYAKEEDIPSLYGYATQQWVNEQEFAHQDDLLNMSFNDIQDSPITENNDGEVNIVDDKGNIALKVNDEGLYVKDVIAGNHVLSNKADTTYVDNSIAELVDGAPETLDTLNELSAALKDNADIIDVLNQSISSKQDIISDIETIRQGAAKGATALQSYTEQYKGTVTGVKINGSTKSPSNGVVDLGTVITSHQDISGKQDTLVSGTNIKTINGQSILGSGNITIEGGTGNVNKININLGVLDIENIIYVTLTDEQYNILVNINSSIDVEFQLNGIVQDYYRCNLQQISKISDKNFVGVVYVRKNSTLSRFPVDYTEKYVYGTLNTSKKLSITFKDAPYTNFYTKSEIDTKLNDITGSGYSDANVQAVDEISTIIDVDMDKYIVETTDDNIILDNNKYYKKTNVSSNINISLNMPDDNTVFTSFAIEFTTSDSGTSVSLPNTIKWLNGELPIFENNFTYQISIMNNLGVCAKYA